jgi:hypothetical protein
MEITMPVDSFPDDEGDDNKEFFNSLPFPANSPDYPDHARLDEDVPEDADLRARIMGFDELNDSLSRLAERLENEQKKSRGHLSQQFNPYINFSNPKEYPTEFKYPKKFIDPRNIDPPV